MTSDDEVTCLSASERARAAGSTVYERERAEEACNACRGKETARDPNVCRYKREMRKPQRVSDRHFPDYPQATLQANQSLATMLMMLRVLGRWKLKVEQYEVPNLLSGRCCMLA